MSAVRYRFKQGIWKSKQIITPFLPYTFSPVLNRLIRCKSKSYARTAGLPEASTPSWSMGRSDCRSEEHTSELQSRFDLVCRLLLEKKKPTLQRIHTR